MKITVYEVEDGEFVAVRDDQVHGSPAAAVAELQEDDEPAATAEPWPEDLGTDELSRLGKRAYEAYAWSVAWTTVRGDPIPEWFTQTEPRRRAWMNAAAAVANFLKERPDGEDQADEDEPEHCRGCGNDDGPSWCEGIGNEDQADEDEPARYTLTSAESATSVVLLDCKGEVASTWDPRWGAPGWLNRFPNESATSSYTLEAWRGGQKLSSGRLAPGPLLLEVRRVLRVMGLPR